MKILYEINITEHCDEVYELLAIVVSKLQEYSGYELLSIRVEPTYKDYAAEISLRRIDELIPL